MRSIKAVNKLGGVYSHTESPTKAVYILKSSQWTSVGLTHQDGRNCQSQ